MKTLKRFWKFILQFFCGKTVHPEKGGNLQDSIEEEDPAEESGSWLSIIQSIVFRTDSGNRGLILKTHEKISLSCFEPLEVSIVLLEHPLGVRFTVDKSKVEEHVTSKSIFYDLPLLAVSEWSGAVSVKKVRGQWCSTNIARVECSIPGEKRTFFFDPQDRFFYPEPPKGYLEEICN